MSDKANIEIVPEEPEGKKPQTKKRWLLFGGMFLLVLLLLVWFLLSNTTSLDGLKRFFRYFGKDDTQYGTLQFETYGSCSYALADGRFAVATQSGATLFAESGSALCRVQGSFLNPAMKSAGEYLLVYDIGGTRLVLLNAGGETLLDTTASAAIYDAEVSPEGYLSVLCEGTDCRAQLTVYSKTGATPYIRRAKTSYLSACALSPDGSLAAAVTIGQQDIQFVSTVQLYQTDSEDVAAELSLGAQTVYDLRFLSRQRLCAVGEDRLVFFDADGSLVREYAVDDGVIAGFSFDGDGFVTVVYDLYEAGAGSRLVTLNENGEELGAVTLPHTPMHISACGSYVAALTDQTLTVYDSSLTVRNSTDNSGYLKAFVRADGTAMCVSSGEATLYIP